ncbi:hypothetical protein TIFTF001_037969 [Ficus carica]|uniref:Transmembrane protein n=1 Tax=Ficus carica TaxID=3494 RepID=A0AA88E6K8_FICCA|nr:hypothetical protein TIFTF001_037969 [Ficus carica]
MPSEGWVEAVSEPSVESWSPFVILRSGHRAFPPCYWPSFRDDLIAPMVAPALRGVALLGVVVVPLFLLSVSVFVCNKGGDLAFVSPVVRVFLCVWDRGLLRISPSGLITYVLSRRFVDFRSIWWFPSRSVAGRLSYSEFYYVGLSLCWCLALAL